MSLETRLSELITRSTTEVKLLKTYISGSGTGDVSGLATVASNLVAAINEVKAIADAAAGGGSGDLLSANNLSDVANQATALANLGGLNQGQVDGRVSAIGDPKYLQLSNNLSDLANQATALANLGGLNQAQVDARIQLIVDAAPANLDTLSELAAALGNDSDFAATVTAGLANRLRVDGAQGLSVAQQQQGRDNLDVYSKAEIGNPDVDLVALFEAGLL